MKMITISRSGHTVNADSDRDIMRALAQSIVKINVTGPFDGVTDNSGGVRTKFVNLAPPAATVAVSGSNLAAVGDVGAGFSSLRDALRTLYAKANTLAAAAGIAPVAYTGGGTDGSGTVAAVSQNVAGASTGPSAGTVGPLIVGFNNAVYNLGALANRLAEATGDDALKLNPSNQVSSLVGVIGPLSVDPGAAGNAGVSAVAMASAFAAWAGDIASIAAVLNAVTTPGTHRILAVR